MQPRLFKEWIKKGYPFLRLFVLTLFILKTPINVGLDPYRKGSIVNVTTYVATINYQETTPFVLTLFILKPPSLAIFIFKAPN